MLLDLIQDRIEIHKNLMKVDHIKILSYFHAKFIGI